tara:strand:+ start:329 stop:652 length:324 start_codon:yes stop_codon:yes gene_type:complete
MDKIVGLVLGATIIGGILYNNAEKIKIEFMKQKGIYQAKKIARDFFIEKLKENPNITLDEAILKFEDTKNEYSTLEEFVKDKTRTVESYRKAYKKIFKEANNKLNQY